MKKNFTLAVLLVLASTIQAQNIRVNLNDGTNVVYNKDSVSSIEFNPAAYSGKMYYATTDMTFAEFFEGELHTPAEALIADGVDVFTSATSGKASRFSSCVISKEGNQILGVKAVSVSMTEDVYNKLTDEQKARFTFVEDSVFASSKQLLSNGSFSAYTAAPVVMECSSVNLSSGTSANWGNYVISLGIDRTAIPSADLQGAVITTTSGQKFALTPLNNLWLNTSELAFSVNYFTEPHGNHPAFTHTAGLQGKTISNITYYLKGKDNVSIPCNVYVKQQTAASVSLDGAAVAGVNPIVNLLMKDIPSDANYTLASVKKGSGRSAKLLDADKYTYSDGVLNILDTAAVGDNYNVIFNSDKYVSIGSSIKFGSDILPTELQNKLAGTYVELFSEEGILASKWDSLWIAECSKYVGEENADSSANMLKYSMLGTLTGEEATAKFGDGSNGFAPDIQFSCHFLHSVSKFVFDGCTIKGLDSDGKEVFAHKYVKVGYDSVLDFHIYKSTDDNEDEFKFFALRSDNPFDTYHIEFRYGSKEEGILDYFSGKYAYWMAAGVLENDDNQCEKSIRLFVKENLEPRVE